MLKIIAYGTPAPQGSKSFKGMAGGHAILAESSKKVKPWREAVKWAALEACAAENPSQQGHGMGCVSGPIAVQMIFTMLRPKSAKKGAMPSTRPDLSKLVRSTEDSLTDAGTWEDDARVVECFAMKVFPGEHPDALHIPGVVIRISSARNHAL